MNEQPIGYKRVDLSLSDHERYFNLGWNALLRRLEAMGFQLPDERYTVTDAGRAMLKEGE